MSLLDQAKEQVKSQEMYHATSQQGVLTFHRKIVSEHLIKPIPKLNEGDILLKVTAMTTCGSNPYLSHVAMTYMHDGVLLAHEFMGVIDRVADHVYKLKVGQRIVVAFNLGCDRCEYSLCNTTHEPKLQGKLDQQKKVTHVGSPYLKNEAVGEQPQYIRVTFADLNCLPIPDDVPDEKALYLSDIIPTAYHGCEIENVKQDSTVTIWGLGPTIFLF